MASVPGYARYLADREPLAVMRENLGRLGALTVVVALARRAPPAPVTYPEEQVLIG